MWWWLLACATPRGAPPPPPSMVGGQAVLSHAPRSHYLRAVVFWELGACEEAMGEMALARVFDPHDTWLEAQEAQLKAECFEAARMWEELTARDPPPPVQARFVLDIDAPGVRVPGRLPGVFVVALPDRYFLQIQAPVGGPVVTAVSDGSHSALYLHRDRVYVSSDDPAELLEGAGMDLSISDLLGLLLGRPPQMEEAPSVAERLEGAGSTAFHFPRDGRERVAVLEAEGGGLLLFESRSEGEIEWSVALEGQEGPEDLGLPAHIRLEAPGAETSLDFRVRGWSVQEIRLELFQLPVPPGAQVLTPEEWAQYAAER